MTFDFKAFAIAPKFIVNAGSIIDTTELAAQYEKKGLRKLTPYLYACFGDVTLGGGALNTGGQSPVGDFSDSLTGRILKTGCIIPVSRADVIDVAVNPVLVIMFAH